MKSTGRIHHPKHGPLTWRVTDSIDNLTTEVEYTNIDGKVVGYWAYGSWDPELPYQGELSEKRPSFSDKIGILPEHLHMFILATWALLAWYAAETWTSCLVIVRGDSGWPPVVFGAVSVGVTALWLTMTHEMRQAKRRAKR